MKEELLIYVWKYKLFNSFELYGTNNEKITILSTGSRNNDSGPDFFNSKIKINNQIWAGNTEMHIRSSDWMRHQHHLDKAYNNVILHVVFTHDKEVYVNNRRLVVLELNAYIDKQVIDNYEKLERNKFSFLKCSGQYNLSRDFIFNNWIHSLYISRIERKNKHLLNHLVKSNNNWEYIFFLSLAYSFGMKLNSDAFFNLMASVPFLFLKNNNKDVFSMEAMLFGQAGFLNFSPNEKTDDYYKKLYDEYMFLKSKYSLSSLSSKQFSFFRTRPVNFPTIRISQLSVLLVKNNNIFADIMNASSLKELKVLFDVEASEYWKNHFVFFKESKIIRKTVSEAFVERIIINCVIPFRVLYYRKLSNYEKIESAIEFAYSVMTENNSVTKEFEKINFISGNALESQVQLELKEMYCIKGKCLSCFIGKQILDKA